MFVEPLLGARPTLALGDSEGSDLAPAEGTQDPQGDDTGEVTSGARMQVCTASCRGDTENGHIVHSESSRKAAWRRRHSAGS